MGNEICLSIYSNIYNKISGHNKENRSIFFCYEFRPAITMILLKEQQTDGLSFLSVPPPTFSFLFTCKSEL